jgi:hypothetical protein
VIRTGNVHARIGGLLREIADAFDELAAEQAARRPPQKRARPQRELGPDPNPDATARVRRTLRAKGIAV